MPDSTDPMAKKTNARVSLHLAAQESRYVHQHQRFLGLNHYLKNCDSTGETSGSCFRLNLPTSALQGALGAF